jgi:membrane associated rhomboid family serine protease
VAKRHVPWLTLGVALLTATGFAAQLADDRVLTALQRDPTGLHLSDPWRVLTPLLVQSDGWTQAGFNLVTLVLAGIVVEARYGRPRWLLLYLGAGVVGQLLGYAWNPPGGGGNSVAVCGLVGALIAAMLAGRPVLPGPALLLTPYYPVALLGLDVAGPTGQVVGLVATAALVGALLATGRSGQSTVARWVPLTIGGLAVAEAVALVAYRDHHGAALLTGVGIALVLTRPGVRRARVMR